MAAKVGLWQIRFQKCVIKYRNSNYKLAGKNIVAISFGLVFKFPKIQYFLCTLQQLWLKCFLFLFVLGHLFMVAFYPY